MTQAVAASFAQLGRFRLLRELGRGAQARVMLAHDPRLDREVALKLLNPDADSDAVNEWLNEARAVSRLSHANIVPVFEADEHDGNPYLVFEYVEGPTLSQARRGKGAMPAKEAVGVMLGVLDALAVAHEQGIVHRDLKPSNILLGSDGRARVMDFGIAARVAQGDGRIVGTPGYMSPEAARGEAPVPAMDVFSAGAMLGEMLSGAPLLRETNPYRAVERIQREDLELPAGTRVDTTLRGIVQRAVSRDIGQRYESARAMHTALSSWLNPTDAASPDAGSSHATLEFLLRRMRHKTDFPALSQSVVRIQRVAGSETESLRSLSDEILKDVALTNKLLRMVNTVHFTSVAGEGISTISRAVALVGFAGIRNMALSVVLLEHMGDKAHAAQLKEEFLRALMAGTLAEELSPVAREGEEAFLGALFQNLGRLLTECYFPEEAVQVRQQVGRLETVQAVAAREAAAKRVLGLSFDELGAGVAKAWGLPDSLQRALRPPEGDVPTRHMGPGVERLRWLGRGANAVTDAILAHDGQAQTDAVADAASLYAPVLGLNSEEMVKAVQSARSRLTQLAQAMSLHVAPGAPARRLLQSTQPAAAATAAAANAEAKTLVTRASGNPSSARQQLQHTLDELRAAAPNKSLRLNEVLNLALDSMHRALDFRCVLLCLREAGSTRLQGRLSLGAGAADISSAFRFTPDLGATGDLFAWVSAKGADLLITDAASVSARLPAWYRSKVNAQTFLLMPLMLKGAPIGMIYADKLQAGSITLGEQELLLLRGLRDQTVGAFARG